eukprot:CAMPEP_0194782800 /NCGR_PEP_ID=MMETSP0323_2-20130528/78884_1 /TAXON_ID=2866 ORGANISM="Crypthecodinium cohnii, Strain Seligo" /NCGR_SAMPLE_ID=MMETSP0323_2 /ASSEMBLY_ACC=CAM_ASM_000346 /LENGTH=132 /DNA_ID=CAMNT_0039721639 /DNA_START=517 /DNA_END=912 /DNA_ORIENTATION=+
MATKRTVRSRSPGVDAPLVAVEVGKDEEPDLHGAVGHELPLKRQDIAWKTNCISHRGFVHVHHVSVSAGAMAQVDLAGRVHLSLQHESLGIVWCRATLSKVALGLCWNGAILVGVALLTWDAVITEVPPNVI